MKNMQVLKLVDLLRKEILENKEKIKRLPNQHIKLDAEVINELMDYFLAHTLELAEILQYIDFRNASLVNRKVSYVDLSIYFNINPDPQLVYGMDLIGTKLVGNYKGKKFDDTKCVCTDFSDAENVDLDPQTLANKNLFRSKLCGVDLRGKSLADVIFEEADFSGAIISEDMKKILENGHVYGLENAIIKPNIHLDSDYIKCKKYINNLFNKK